MAEIAMEKERVRDESYSQVINEAAKQSQRRIKLEGGDDIITLSDVFNALCAIYPNVFAELLGVIVAVPEVKPVSGFVNTKDLCYSSEVDRYLSPYGGIVEEILDSFSSGTCPLDYCHIAATLLWEPISETKNIMAICGVNTATARPQILKALKTKAAVVQKTQHEEHLPKTFENIRKIRDYLCSKCFGQKEAINAIISQLSIFWGMAPSDRGAKPLSFMFVGAPGTGKNHLTTLLQDVFESLLGIPKVAVIDFAQFATEQMPIDLKGRDPNWKDGGRHGVFPNASKQNPNGIIVVENYDLGHPVAISILDSILETGYCIDGYNDEKVCFSNNIFIIITHKKEFAESDEFLALVSNKDGATPRDKIVEGLVKFEPKFYSTLRLVDMPILFRKHDFKSFFAIVKDKLAAIKQRFREAYDAQCEFESEDVYRILLEMHPDISSAHPIVSALESAILMPAQDWILNNYADFSKIGRICIKCDTLPDFEGAPKRSSFSTFEDWMEARTKKRLLQAKRLVFDSKIVKTSDAVVLLLTNIAYKVMPSIEDSDYFSVKVPDVSFSDLVGVDIVKERVTEVIDYFNHPDEGRVKPDTGIILYGPPGTGKTSVAKAIAKEMGVPFIMVSGADFLNSSGNGVDNVKKLFAAARRYGAVVFIDEIDAIGSRGSMWGENARIINTFLTELDGFRERNMLVIGATNRYNDLDEALVRSGRLSLKIQLGYLHKPEDRRTLIKNALAEVRAEVDSAIIDKLVETTNAWSPANLLAMVNGGVRNARKECAKIELKHFVKARTTVLLGEDPQSGANTKEESQVTAVHEAGHAVAAILNKIPFVQVTIQGVGAVAGFVESITQKGFSTKDSISKQIEMCLAGRAAEELLAEPSDGVQSDFWHATLLASKMIKIGLAKGNIMTIYDEEEKDFALRHSAEIEDILDERMSAVRRLLNEHFKFLKVVSETLESQKLLFEADIIAIRKEVEGE